jgi:hypothetical protein
MAGSMHNSDNPPRDWKQRLSLRGPRRSVIEEVSSESTPLAASLAFLSCVKQTCKMMSYVSVCPHLSCTYFVNI